MKVFLCIVITIVLMTIDVQSQGILHPVTKPLSELGDKVGQASTSAIDKSLQAETACKCMSQGYVDDKYKACDSDGDFDVRQFAQQVVAVLPTCSKLDIPKIDEIVAAMPSTPIEKLGVVNVRTIDMSRESSNRAKVRNCSIRLKCFSKLSSTVIVGNKVRLNLDS